MKVQLISYTEEPIKVIFLAARICHSAKPFEEIKEEFSNKEYVIKLLTKLYKIGHHSIFEHATFTFLIEDISRVTSHQLVRHRIASFSQRSQRYSKIEPNAFILPSKLKDDKRVKELLDKAIKLYYDLINEGIHQEDARYIIPQATTTRLIMTMNLRELFHFWNVRLHPAAQWELRKLAKQTLTLIMNTEELMNNLLTSIGYQVD